MHLTKQTERWAIMHFGNLIMKGQIICYLILCSAFGYSKQQQAPSSILPFTVTTVLTPETKELVHIRSQVSTFLKGKDYDKLDELAAKLRSSKDHYPDGFWKLNEVYYALAVSNNIYGLEMFNNIPDTSFENRLAELQDWVKAKPESITARVALANVQVDYAWDARGGDHADKVKDEGWHLFGERLNEAAKTLLEITNMNDKCPTYWTLMISVGLGKQLPKEQLEDIFNQAIASEPDFVGYYVSRANFLLPRWYGSKGEWENELAKSADKMGGDDGDALYAQVVWSLNRHTYFDNIFKENNLSWPRVKKGFEVLERRYPNSLAVKNEGAYLAVFARDAQGAREFFDETKGQMDKTIWKSQGEFRSYATYAYMMTLGIRKPITLHQALATASAKTTFAPFPPECRGYDQNLISEIRDKWFDMFDNGNYPRQEVGKIVARFKLHSDGSVSDITLSGSTNLIAAQTCIQAINKCAPFPTWPATMRSFVGQDCRDIHFTFEFRGTETPFQ
jgi:hypothetical protein